MMINIDPSHEILVIDVSTALKPLCSIVANIFCDCYDYMATRLNTSVKAKIGATSLAVGVSLSSRIACREIAEWYMSLLSYYGNALHLICK